MTQMNADGDEQDEQTFAIIGAAMEVHTTLGHGFLERVYQEALAIELEERGIPFVLEAPLPVLYKGRELDASYRADFICFDSVILELKAISELTDAHLNQVLNYLKATNISRGLLLNFGNPRLDYRRVIQSKNVKS